LMERRMRGNSHVRCGTGEKVEIISKPYLSLSSVQVGEPDKILNNPVKTSAFIPEISSGEKVVAFGDYSYYWIADRQGRSFQRLNELYAVSGQVGFRAYQRVDGKLVLPEAVKVMAMKAS
ncbi:phage major capsid protein, partial [Desulfitispora alkaliphila]|uniref:phage major capsid protein n=1 Tax=Desulfitispora alkaliphila TaxID=622674 RepID=UPI003D209068